MPAKRTYLVYYAVAILILGSESVLTKAFLLDSLAPQAMLVLHSETDSPRSWSGASVEPGEPAPSGKG